MAGFGKLNHFRNLVKFQVSLLHFSAVCCVMWFWMEDFWKRVPLILVLLKASFLIPHVSYFSVMLLYMIVIIVCRRFETPFYRHPSLYTHLPLYLFSQSPTWAIFFWQYCPNEIRDKQKINAYGKVVSSYLKTTIVYATIYNYICNYIYINKVRFNLK